MLPTPNTTHVSFANVYEPAEDSFLLLDTLSSSSETAYLQSRFSPPSPAPLALEIGPGSGVVLAFVAAHAPAIFGRHDVATLGIDINPFACRATRETVAANAPCSPFLDVMMGDLASAVRPHAVDVLIFNPPYVPSEEIPAAGEQAASIFERDNHYLALATDGGSEGMQVTNRLLDALPGVLSARGVAYVLLCAQNKPAQVKERISGWGAGWDVQIVGSSGKTGGWERLCILRVARGAKGVQGATARADV